MCSDKLIGYTVINLHRIGIAMDPIDLDRPFPDYVTCPHCNEPEVEVWCYAVEAKCHNCGRVFDHALPIECQSICTGEVRAQAAHVPRSATDPQTCTELLDRS